MSRSTFVMRDGRLVDVREAAPLVVRHGRAPAIRTDGMDPIRSMASGRMFDSKSAYYADVKANGCEVVGNERLARGGEFKPVGVREDMKRAIQELCA